MTNLVLQVRSSASLLAGVTICERRHTEISYIGWVEHRWCTRACAPAPALTALRRSDESGSSCARLVQMLFVSVVLYV